MIDKVNKILFIEGIPGFCGRRKSRKVFKESQ
jgi:hypothetical protein